MIRSMTGFGRGEVLTQQGRIVIEVRTGNGRGLQTTVRGRDTPLQWEAAILKAVPLRLKRGNVSASVEIDRSAADAGAGDLEPWRVAHQRLLALSQELNIPGNMDLATLAASVRYFATPTGGGTQSLPEWQVAAPALDAAVDAVVHMREQEGAALTRDLEARIQLLAGQVDELARRAEDQPDRIAVRVKERLQAALRRLRSGEDSTHPDSPDSARLEQEIAFLCDRADVTEELVRLRAHLEHLAGLFKGQGQGGQDSGTEVGRKIEFLVQEIGRELNTLGVKIQDADASTIVVEAKAGLEKIREQAQNIE